MRPVLIAPQELGLNPVQVLAPLVVKVHLQMDSVELPNVMHVLGDLLQLVLGMQSAHSVL